MDGRSPEGLSGHSHGVETSPGSVAVPRAFLRDPIAWVIVLLGLFVVGYAALWVTQLAGAAASDAFTGLATMPAGLLVVAICVRIKRAEHIDRQTRRMWSLLALAVACYGLGALINFAAVAIPGLRSLAGLTFLLEICTYPLAWFALAAMPGPKHSANDQILFSLDVAVVAWSAAILLWHFVMFPAGRHAGADYVAIFGASTFPILDLSLVLSLGALVPRIDQAGMQRACAIACGAFVLMFAGDLVSGVQGLYGAYTPGGLSGIVYGAGAVALAAAAYIQLRTPFRVIKTRGLTDYSRTIPLLPYAAVAVAFVAPMLNDWDDPLLLRQHVPATGLLLVLVIARLAVTARDNARLATTERTRLAAAVDQAAEAMITTDAAGKITYVNPAFTRITGYASDEVVGRKSDFMHEEADPARVADMNTALASGTSWAGRLLARRKDGSTVEVDMAISPMRAADGTRIGAVEVARDISRERALEAQLAQAQRMEAVGRLAGGVAHDFNNILTVITGFTELASANVPEGSPVAEDLAEILKASDRAAALTRALLAFGRRQVLQPTNVDLNEMLAGLTPMLELLMGENVRLTIESGASLGPAVTDRAQIEQVVLNLATNARDSMPDGGQVTIATADADLDAAYARTHVGVVPGPYVALIVSDTGAGMTPEVMDHAFEPFFTTKARGKGTGLGLATVIGVAQMSGGSVDVTSALGSGSVFTVYLPRTEGAATPEAATRARTNVAGTETILIAEDEEGVRLYIERVLRQAGYRVMAAANGQEALAMARTIPHLDLLLSDMVMPGMGGPELAKQLAVSHPEARTMFASGYSDEALEDGFGSDGNITYLSKPFTADILLVRIRNVLDGRV